jgi:hypothetical protein
VATITSDARDDAEVQLNVKRSKTLFDHYCISSSAAMDPDQSNPERQLNAYLDDIGSSSGKNIWDYVKMQYSLRKLFEKLLCSPASSAPVERIFSQSGLILRPNRAKMSDTLLENLMFLKCNNSLV